MKNSSLKFLSAKDQKLVKSLEEVVKSMNQKEDATNLKIEKIKSIRNSAKRRLKELVVQAESHDPQKRLAQQKKESFNKTLEDRLERMSPEERIETMKAWGGSY